MIDTAEGSYLTESKNDLQTDTTRNPTSFGYIAPGSTIVLVVNSGRTIKGLKLEIASLTVVAGAKLLKFCTDLAFQLISTKGHSCLDHH